MATATWCARARRLRTTRRRRSKRRRYCRMGGVRRYPSIRHLRAPNSRWVLLSSPSGARATRWLYPSYRLRRDQSRVPPPQIIVRQVRATPPAVDRIVAAEVFLVGDDGSAEFGERQPASQVGGLAGAIILR